MIKLICPDDFSDNIVPVGDDLFKCNDCNKEFTLDQAWWKSEE